MNSSKIDLIFFSLILLLSFDLSSQRPSDILNSPVSSISSSQLIPSNQGNIITTIESLPAVELFRELITKQNQLVDTMMPIMIRALTNPVPGLAEALQRSLSLFGVTSYLVGPSIARSARSLSPVVEPLVGSSTTESFVSKLHQITQFKPLIGQAMVIFGLDSDQCKEAIACQAGKQVATDYPILASYLSQASSNLGSADDKIATILMEILSSPDPQCMSNCPNLSRIAKYWNESGEKDLKTVLQEALSDSISESFISYVFDSANSVIGNGFSSLTI